MDIDSETDRLFAELGIGGDGGSANVSVSVTASNAPPPPPPPPPPASSSSGSSFKLKTKDVKDAQKEIDDIFDSVISFAGKTSGKKGPPPTVAPKPKRNMHVSSYTMQVKNRDSSPSALPAKPAPPLQAKPSAPPATKPSSRVEPAKPAPPPTAPPSSKPPPAKPPKLDDQQQPVAMVAFGPGLETFEVNCYGDFQVSCLPDVDEDEIEASVLGPTGTKPVDITSHGNGQFSCSYLPTSAGEHKVTVKVRGDHIPGSPFMANVQFAAYTDKCSASGPGLVSGTTTDPCRFKIRTKDDAGYARLRIHILGPSKAEPIEMTENHEEKCVDVMYNPSAPGDYNLRVLWGDAHVHGSPFTVAVTGDVVNDGTKVKVTGDGLRGGHVKDTLKIFVEGEVGAGPGPLGVRIVGPSKPTIVADDSSDNGVELSYVCHDPGQYQLVLKWGEEELAMSPHTFTITGEGRVVNPLLCSARGPGVEGGAVGMPATFTVDVPDDAGPGSLSVSISGLHPPKPIEITNNEDNTMTVTYHPVAPGDYKIELYWADQHILGSPYTSVIMGSAERNPQLVYASGEPLGPDGMKCNQLGTINVVPHDGAGPGPLRAKLEGPSKGALELSNSQDGTMLVSFVPKDPGDYKLHLLWGDKDDESAEIHGSPFSISVTN